MPVVCFSAVRENQFSGNLQRQPLGLEEYAQSGTEILEELPTRLPNINQRLTRAYLRMRTGYSITQCIFAYPLNKFQYKV